MCIEVHDHHCPFMGTCIGRRNTRYFVLFLFNASFICFVSAVLCLVNYLTSEISLFSSNTSKDVGYWFQLVNFGLMLYLGLTTISLACFGFDTNQNVMRNVTTNEQLRKKWNAKSKQVI